MGVPDLQGCRALTVRRRFCCPDPPATELFLLAGPATPPWDGVRDGLNLRGSRTFGDERTRPAGMLRAR